MTHEEAERLVRAVIAEVDPAQAADVADWLAEHYCPLDLQEMCTVANARCTQEHTQCENCHGVLVNAVVRLAPDQWGPTGETICPTRNTAHGLTITEPAQLVIPPHPAALLFPMCAHDELTRLIEDIRVHGLQHPIVLDREGRLLDGRNRWLAVQQLGIPCPTRTYTGDDPVTFVVSQNLHRRHLTDRERAEIAATLATNEHGGDRRSIKSPNGDLKPTQAQAAVLLNVSKRRVERAVAAIKAPEKSESPKSELSKVKAPDVAAANVKKSQTIGKPEIEQSTPQPSQRVQPTATDQRTPSAIAGYLGQVGAGPRSNRGSLRDIHGVVNVAAVLPRGFKDLAALLQNPRIIEKLRTVPPNDRRNWLVAVHDGRKALAGIEGLLRRAFELAPAPPTGAPAATADPEAPLDSEE